MHHHCTPCDPAKMPMGACHGCDGLKPSTPAPGSTFPVGSRWRTDDGMEITVTMHYETTPGCWRLCYDGPNGIGGYMGQNHIDRLTPLDPPPPDGTMLCDACNA